MLLTLITTVSSLIFALYSCSKDELSTNDENNVENPIKTNESKNDNDDATSHLLFCNDQNVLGKGSIKIIEIKLWRKKNDCLSGLGICSVSILGYQVWKSTNDYDLSYASRTILCSVEDKTVCNKTMNLVLATPTNGLSNSDLQFYVDEDIYGYDEESNDYIMIKKGVYQYNPNIGQFGGYVVNFDFHKIQ